MQRSKWLSLVFAAALASGSARGQGGLDKYQPNPIHSFVIVAHEDDWQLFMGDIVGKRIALRDSVTFIYLTAGDDGRDSAYWRTRERAALASTRVATLSDTSGRPVRCAVTVVRSHPIENCALGKTISYFLRLPDGRRNGAGFPRYGSQSLRKLRRNAIASITAVDGSTTYNSWGDLLGTIVELIGSDRRAGTIELHATDPSIRINPHDHFDHRTTGLLVSDLRAIHDWPAWYYVGYALGTRAANRSGEQGREKVSLFRAYDDEMMRANPKWSAYAEHPTFYSQCMVRTYLRKAPSVGKR